MATITKNIFQCNSVQFREQFNRCSSNLGTVSLVITCFKYHG